MLMIRKQLVSEEKVASNRASFTCTNCGQNYSDLEINRIMDFSTCKMTCYLCGCEVLENIINISRPGNSLIAKFNDQFGQLFKLVEECMKYEMPSAMIDPEITDEHIQKASFARVNQGKVSATMRQERQVSDRKNNPLKLFDQSITISFADRKNENETAIDKPQPIWLSNENDEKQLSRKRELAASTTSSAVTKGNVLEDLILYETSQNMDTVQLSQSDSSSEHEKIDFPENLDIIENSPKSAESSPSPHLTDSIIESDNPNTQLSEDEILEETKITVNSKEYALEDITEDMIKLMTQEEHENYIRALNELYKDSF